MRLYATGHLAIHYHATEQLIETFWQGSVSSLDYRQGLKVSVQTIQQYKVRRWLDNHSLGGVVQPTDQRWTIQEWTSTFLPLAGKLKKVAQVNSPDGFQYGLATILQQIIYVGKVPFACQEFDNPLLARTWLLS